MVALTETSTAKAINTDKAFPTEVEAKFTLESSALLHELATSADPVPGYSFGEPAVREMKDIYLDTDDYRLLRQGYQLRVRVGDSHWSAALKSRGVASEVGIYQRLEMDLPLDEAALPATISSLPGPISVALAAIAPKHGALSVICVLEQVRHVRTVTSQSPSRKAEETPILMHLYLDELSIRSAMEEPVLAHAYEIEVELEPGVDLAELQVLADRFIGTYGLVPSQESKLERALRIVSRHPVESPENWQGLRPDLHMGEACRIIWHEQFVVMLLNEAGVRYSADPEYVHDGRVAIRRARAAARLYQDYFKPKSIRKFLKQLRRTAQLLGAVRDLDVAIGKLFGYQQKSRKKSAGDLQETLDGWMARRSTAHQELVAWFDSADYAEFVKSFLCFCRTSGAGLADLEPEAGAELTPSQVRHVVPTMLLANFAHVRAYETWFEREEEPPLPTLHRLRIECKYLRYNLEFVSGLLGPESAELIAWLKELQDDLGDLNDAAVSKELLSNGDNADEAVLSRYEAAQDRAIAKLRSQTHADFMRFVGSENRQRLLMAIANL